MGLKVCMDLEGSVEQLDTLNLQSGGELTISSGAITVTNSVHTVDTESDAGTDDLNTISGGSAGDVILLSRANAARAVVLKHNVGNIKTPSGTDHELTALGFVVLKHDGSNWQLQSGNGSGYLLNKLACLTVATSNITLNDTQVINGVSCGADARVLLVGQTDETENGPWIVKAEDPYYPTSGDWIRPADFQNGFSVSGHAFYIEQGTEFSDSVWMITNGYGEDIVGADDLNAVNLVGGRADSFDIVSLTEDDTNTSSDYLPKNDGSNKKIKRNDLLNPGFKTLDDAATVTINLADPVRTFAVVLGGNRTLALVNASVGDEFWVKLIQDGTGSRTVTWWDTINWSGGSAPTLTPTADKADYLLFKCSAINTYDCVQSILNLDTNEGSTVDFAGSIIACWKMDETSGTRTDSVGSLDLTEVGSVSDVSGVDGNAAWGFSTSNYLKASHNELLVPSGSFSLATWVDPTSIAETGVIITKGPQTGANTFRLYLTSGAQLFWSINPVDSETGTRYSTNVDVTEFDVDGGYAFIMGVVDWDNKKIKLSVNGAAFEERNINASVDYLHDIESDLLVGITENGVGTKLDPFVGRIDETTLFNKALSLEEVTALYNSGSGLFYPYA